jgi:uncharacterized membrane protein
MVDKENLVNDKKPDSLIQKLEVFYSQHILPIWLSVIFIPLIVISIGYLIWPEIFYDQFIWRYFWGTIEADAQEENYGEVTEAYNPINTIFYAIIVIIVLYWLYKMFKKYKIDIDFKFLLAILPFILIGSISRALEDAELFNAPMVYLFIAPIIYIFIGVVVIFIILLGAGIRNYSNRTNLSNGLLLIGGTFVALDIIYIVTFFIFKDQFTYILNPLIPVGISIIIILILIKYTKIIKRFEISNFLLAIGLWFLLISLIVLAQWQTIPSWSDAYLAANPGKDVQLQPMAFILVCALAFAATFIVYIIVIIFKSKYQKILPFISGVNLLLFFGHFLDASATFIAIDYYGYAEKHVLPTFMIQLFNTASIMLVLKAGIVVLVIYFIDILYKKHFQQNPTLTGLVKIAILVLGLGPGLRDILRLGIGV